MTSASAVVTSTTPLWYATRATGIVALVLLSASMALGITVRSRVASERWPRMLTIGLHRNLSLLVVTFLALHIGTALVDTYAPVGWWSLVVPFVSSYRPLWLGLGTVAFDLLVAVTVTSLLRTRISPRLWRLVHWASYACWPTAVVHSLGTGSDARQPAVLAITVACVVGVLGAGVWRLFTDGPANAAARVLAGLTGAVAVVVAAAWTLQGPLKAGWAARAGTPTRLIAKAAADGTVPTTATSSAASTSVLPALPLTTDVTGTVAQTNDSSGLTDVTITGTGTSPVRFQVVITGTPDGDGGVSMTTSRVDFGPLGHPQQYTGRIDALNGPDIQATVADASGSALALNLHLTITTPSVGGTLTATLGAGSQ